MIPCRSPPQPQSRPQFPHHRRPPHQPQPRRPTAPSCAPVQPARSPIRPATAGRYPPPALSWRTEKPPHSAPTSPRLLTSARRCGRRTRVINGTAGPGQDGTPAPVRCRSRRQRQPRPPSRPQPPVRRRPPHQPRPRRPTTPSCAPAQRPRSPMPAATAGRYRPQTPSWRMEKPPHSAPTSLRSPTSVRRCGRRTRAINGTAGPGQDGTPAMIP